MSNFPSLPMIPTGTKIVTYQPPKEKKEEIGQEVHGREGAHDVSTLTKSNTKELSSRISLALGQSEDLKPGDHLTPPVQENHDVAVLNKKTDVKVKLGFKSKLKEAGPKMKKFAITYLKALNPLHLITDTKAFQSLKEKVQTKFQSKSKKAEVTIKNKQKLQESTVPITKERSQTAPIQNKESVPTTKERSQTVPNSKGIPPQINENPVSSEKKTGQIVKKQLHLNSSSMKETVNKSEKFVRDRLVQTTNSSNKSDVIDQSEVRLSSTEKKPKLPEAFLAVKKDDKGRFEALSKKEVLNFLVQYDLMSKEEKLNLDPSFHQLSDILSSQFKKFAKSDCKKFLNDYISARLEIIKDDSSLEKIEGILYDVLNLAIKGKIGSDDFANIIKEHGEFSSVFKGRLEALGNFQKKLQSLNPSSKTFSEENGIKLNGKKFLKGNVEKVAKDLDKKFGLLFLNMVKNFETLEDVGKEGESQKELNDFTSKFQTAINRNILQQDSVQESMNEIRNTIELANRLKTSGNLHAFLVVATILQNPLIDRIIANSQDIKLKEAVISDIGIIKNIAHPGGNYKNLRPLFQEAITLPASIFSQEKILTQASLGQVKLTQSNEIERLEKEGKSKEELAPLKERNAKIEVYEYGVMTNTESAIEKSVESLIQKNPEAFNKDQVVFETNLNAFINEFGGVGENEVFSQFENSIPKPYREILPLIKGVIDGNKLIESDGKIKTEKRDEGLVNIGVGTSKESVETAMNFFVKLNELKEAASKSPFFKQLFLDQIEQLEKKCLAKSDTWVSNVLSKNPKIKKEYDVLIQWKNEQKEKELGFFANLVVKLTNDKKLQVNENGTLGVVARKSKEGSDDNVGRSKKSRDAALDFLNKLDDVSVGKEKECLKILESLGKNLWFKKVLENHPGVGDVIKVFQEQYQKNLLL